MMKYFHNTVFTITVACLFLFCMNSKAQGKLAIADDSTSLRSYSILKGDTLVIDYDTAYVLNKKIFRLLTGTYQMAVSNQANCANIIDVYEEIIRLQDSSIRSKEYYYQTLKNNFDSLVHQSNRFLEKTAMNVDAIQSSLTRAEGEINNIKSLLKETQSLLNKERGKKLKNIFSGFAVGVVVTTLIFLVAN